MKYPTKKATVGQTYRRKLSKDYEAKGTVDECEHVEGQWYCVTCDKMLATDAALVAHLYEKPKHGQEAHSLAWWCRYCDDPVIPHIRLL